MPHRLAVRGGQPFNRYTLTLWLRSPRGRRLLALEERELKRVLPDLFGRHILQIGNWGRGQRLLGSADMLHRAVLGTVNDLESNAVTEPERLPVMSNSVDAVVLPHTLEFSPSPHKVLREVDRILTDRGRLVILGFSPMSLWGLRGLLGMGYRAFPPGARFFGTGRLDDWLELLGYEVAEIRRFGVGFPWARPRSEGGPFILRSLLNPLMESYLIVAKKRVIPMSLVGRLPRAQVRPFVGRWSHCRCGPRRGIATGRTRQRSTAGLGMSEMSMKAVVIYTDGACRGNPGPGGWGALLSWNGKQKELCGGESPTTNNRMELTAAIRALESLREPCSVALHTDSTYVMQGLTAWLPGWKARGWKTSDKKPVKNQDLWQQLDAACQRHTIDWRWVKGHSGDPGNEAADQLANRGLDEHLLGIGAIVA